MHVTHIQTLSLALREMTPALRTHPDPVTGTSIPSRTRGGKPRRSGRKPRSGPVVVCLRKGETDAERFALRLIGRVDPATGDLRKGALTGIDINDAADDRRKAFGLGWAVDAEASKAAGKAVFRDLPQGVSPSLRHCHPPGGAFAVPTRETGVRLTASSCRRVCCPFCWASNIQEAFLAVEARRKVCAAAGVPFAARVSTHGRSPKLPPTPGGVEAILGALHRCRADLCKDLRNEMRSGAFRPSGGFIAASITASSSADTLDAKFAEFRVYEGFSSLACQDFDKSLFALNAPFDLSFEGGAHKMFLPNTPTALANAATTQAILQGLRQKKQFKSTFGTLRPGQLDSPVSNTVN